MRKTFKLLLVIVMATLLILTNVFLSFANPAPAAPIVYVAADGSGDFNCNGDSDQIEIQAAIDFVLSNDGFTTIHLKPGTYTVNNTIFIGGKTDQKVILEGEAGTTLLLSADVCWEKNKSMIQEKATGDFGTSENGTAYTTGNIVIRGFKIDGNGPNITNALSTASPASAPRKIAYPNNNGGDYYNIMLLVKCKDVEVCNMYMTHNYNDGLQIKSSSNVKFHDNYIDEIGHDGLYSYKCNILTAYNNTIYIQTNCGLRASSTNHVKFYNNVVAARGKGGCGLQIQKEGLINDITGTSIMNDIEVFNNTVYDIRYGGIWVFAYGGNNALENVYAKVHHNTIYNCGYNDAPGDASSNLRNKGGIIVDGFNALIENNVIDGCFGAGINVHQWTGPSLGGPYTLTIRNNIISNTKDNGLLRYSPGEVSGYGIYYELGLRHNFIINYNCFFNNNAADYGHLTPISSEGNLFGQDPLFTDPVNHDYHLKSQFGRWNGSTFVYDDVTSPCVDAGDPSCEYFYEPAGNGLRINIGRYGNTAEASKSRIVAEPAASLEPGIYDLPHKVTLASATEGAVIRYTTDGSQPTMDSKIYRNPLPVTPYKTVIKAFAYKEGMDNSKVYTYEYIIDPAQKLQD